MKDGPESGVDLGAEADVLEKSNSATSDWSVDCGDDSETSMGRGVVGVIDGEARSSGSARRGVVGLKLGCLIGGREDMELLRSSTLEG